MKLKKHLSRLLLNEAIMKFSRVGRNVLGLIFQRHTHAEYSMLKHSEGRFDHRNRFVG